MHHRTKFRKDRSNRCVDNAIFVIFKMAAAAILDLLVTMTTQVVSIVVQNLVDIDEVVSIV